jgi:hypothetical protein
MTIPMPDVQSYLHKIKDGTITNIRLPYTAIETGADATEPLL